ncbi:hypothetical protein Q5741_13715 [Paenibacillus sp. JX-17]|uniref:Uncharacterized protein n=1 Tax=Paenibacillus lacisoli TaxID=3064525 RepID=A0ABT9CFW8_9BACL|nr:hypothetical protein [Paenibacillus sp. JX-17]MDO7907463.1 hypothetical protein [Paenibacillus sp. JX-17]
MVNIRIRHPWIKSRLAYAAATLTVVILGLASRRWAVYLPE